ncbi:zinc ribbon domain-containing protein [Anaerocolumna sp.]|uniref:zinc ribbon domain-containing protein n=1 Tax=Anaerocolumna sp. TaxID=2041569 RepID=UPI0028B2188C|nr:zinc ribbon domain-containing protein [Anaerocolumna sp.]
MAKLSNERKVTYYIGMGLIVLGFILFISVFFQVASFTNDPFSPTSTEPSFSSAIFGFVLMIIGGIVSSIGARGAAGSGVILDPDKAREDLKPFNEAKGQMLNDVIGNIDAVNNITKPTEGKEIIKVKCRSCGALNDEDAKFCKSCGESL